MIFRKKTNQLKQIDFCCLRLLQLGNIAKVRLWTAQMSFKRLKLVSVTKIYLILWIGLDLMVSSNFIKPIYLNWFTILNLKKYESICHKCDHESVSSLHKYRKVASSRPVYYSIFDHFGGATNWDVLLTETCYYCLYSNHSNDHKCFSLLGGM
jgi:hypothetical protein